MNKVPNNYKPEVSKTRKKLILLSVVSMFICCFPLAFGNYPPFDQLLENYKLIVGLSCSFGNLFFWIIILPYFKSRNLNNSFYIGLVFAILSTSETIFVSFFNPAEISNELLTVLGLIDLLSMPVKLLYSLSFVLSKNTRPLILLRLYGLTLVVASIFQTLWAFAIVPPKTADILPFLFIVYSILLILHIQFEYNKPNFISLKEEVLDDIN